MATTTKKIARRVLKRVNGILTVIFVDSATGEQLQNTDGYEFESADGMPGVTTPKPAEPAAAPAAAFSNARSSNNTSNDQGHKDWMAKRTPDDDSNPFDEMDKQGAVIKGGIDNVRNTLVDGIKDVGMRIFGEAVGKNAGVEIGNNIRENGITGAGEAIGNVGANIQNVTNGWGDAIKGGIGSIFSGGPATASGPPVSPNEVFSYGPITTRKMPLAEEWFDKAAAAAAAVNPDIRFQISSAGQSPNHDPATKGKEWTGGHRHDVDESGFGHTADIHPYINGEKITYESNPKLYEDLVTSFAAVGYTGIGVDQAKGYLHVGGGEPHVWVYDGERDVPAPPNIKNAYDVGVQKNKAGEGERILQAYQQQVNQPAAPVQTAKTDPALMGVDPKLIAAVEARKAVSPTPAGQTTRQAAQAPIAPPTQGQGVIQPTRNLGDDIAMNPVQGGPQAAPLYDARYDPVAQQTAMLPQQEEVSSQGLEMGQFIQPEVVNTAQAPTQPVQSGQYYTDAFLKTLIEAEGNPRPNQLFGYGEFDDFSAHPNTKIAYNNGNDYSTAAGLFQINKATYDDFAPKAGVQDFSEASQWAIARTIATTDYKRDTGRDLEADLASGDRALVEQAYTSLANRWSSLPNGQQARTKMDEMVNSFQTHSAIPTPAARPPAAVKDSEPVSTASLNYGQGPDGVGIMPSMDAVGAFSQGKNTNAMASSFGIPKTKTPSSGSNRSDQRSEQLSQKTTGFMKPPSGGSGALSGPTKTKTPTSGFMPSSKTPTSQYNKPAPSGSTQTTKVKTPSTPQPTSKTKPSVPQGNGGFVERSTPSKTKDKETKTKTK